MQEFVDANREHKSYHYTDVPFQVATYGAGAVGTDGNDVVQILTQAIRVLQSSDGAINSTQNPHKFTKRQALLLIAHLVGDIHQPLHVGTPYVDDDDDFGVPSKADLKSHRFEETQGGNFLLIGKIKFHSYWDGNVVKNAMRNADVSDVKEYGTSLAARCGEVTQAVGDATSCPQSWANDTLNVFRQAHKAVKITGSREEVRDHHGGFDHYEWPISLPPKYSKTSTTLGEAQLVKAGCRFGTLLLTVWP